MKPFFVLLCLVDGLKVLAPKRIKGIYEWTGASYGPSISSSKYEGRHLSLTSAYPDLGACQKLNNTNGLAVLAFRGPSFVDGQRAGKKCAFATKTLNIQESGGAVAIIGNDAPSGWTQMYADTEVGTQVAIPTILVSRSTFVIWMQTLSKENIIIELGKAGNVSKVKRNHNLEHFEDMFYASVVILFMFMMVASALRHVLRRIRQWMAQRARRYHINSLPLVTWNNNMTHNISANNSLRSSLSEIDVLEDNDNDLEQPLVNNTNNNTYLHNDSCPICLEDFNETVNQSIAVLPCNHGFHDICVKEWLVSKGSCPICVQDVFTYG